MTRNKETPLTSKYFVGAHDSMYMKRSDDAWPPLVAFVFFSRIGRGAEPMARKVELQ